MLKDTIYVKYHLKIT